MRAENPEIVENPLNVDLGGNLNISQNAQGRSRESNPDVIGNINEAQP